MTYYDIHDRLEEACRSEEELFILKGVFTQLAQRMYDPQEERIRILVTALDFLSCQYGMTEELSDNNKIDCSTLISQSFWEGALIGVPFIAERQRSAPDAKPISYHELQPGDVVVKFPDIESSNDKKHNHVGFYLGEFNGTDYILECNSRDSCIISSLETFQPAGGFRTFIKNERVIVNDHSFATQRRLARSVPKLSRLGARQKMKIGEDRIGHQGIDLMVAPGTDVFAPISGILDCYLLDREDIPSARIKSLDGTMEVIIGNVRVATTNYFVDAGSKIGIAHDFSSRSPIAHAPADGNKMHIHFEVRTSAALGYWVNTVEYQDIRCVNGLYAMKMGTIENPIADVDPFVTSAPKFSKHVDVSNELASIPSI